jgi:2Fe-2S ferredoxin
MITYISPDGTRKEVEVENGYSVMEGAINNEAWLDKIPPMDDMEDSMLDAAFERKPNSRLTCQIEVNESLDGLVVYVAENDY